MNRLALADRIIRFDSDTDIVVRTQLVSQLMAECYQAGRASTIRRPRRRNLTEFERAQVQREYVRARGTRKQVPRGTVKEICKKWDLSVNTFRAIVWKRNEALSA